MQQEKSNVTKTQPKSSPSSKFSTKSLLFLAIFLVIFCVLFTIIKNHKQRESINNETVELLETFELDDENYNSAIVPEGPLVSGRDPAVDNRFDSDTSISDMDYSIWAMANLFDYVDEYLKSQNYYGNELHMIPESKVVKEDYRYFEAYIGDTGDILCVSYSLGDDYFTYLIRLSE